LSEGLLAYWQVLTAVVKPLQRDNNYFSIFFNMAQSAILVLLDVYLPASVAG